MTDRKHDLAVDATGVLIIPDEVAALYWAIPEKHRRRFSLVDVHQMTKAGARIVVPCGECHWWNRPGMPHECSNPYGPVTGLATRPDWFCADGKRKEGG